MLYYKHVRKLSTSLRGLDSEAQAFAQARLNHVRTVRVFANESLEAQRFQRVNAYYHTGIGCSVIFIIFGVCTTSL